MIGWEVVLEWDYYGVGSVCTEFKHRHYGDALGTTEEFRRKRMPTPGDAVDRAIERCPRDDPPNRVTVELTS